MAVEDRKVIEAGLDGKPKSQVHQEPRMGHPMWPPCRSCSVGLLVPMSDYGQEGSNVTIKVWVCTNQECGWSLRIDKGQVSYGKKIQDIR